MENKSLIYVSYITEHFNVELDWGFYSFAFTILYHSLHTMVRISLKAQGTQYFLVTWLITKGGHVDLFIQRSTDNRQHTKACSPQAYENKRQGK